MFPQSATYNRDSSGNKRWISASTESPPTPESNTPIGASRMLGPTDAATRISLDSQFAKTRTQGVDQQQAPYQRLAESGQQLPRFKRLQAADQSHQRPDHPGLTAGQFSFAAVPI